MKPAKSSLARHVWITIGLVALMLFAMIIWGGQPKKKGH